MRSEQIGPDPDRYFEREQRIANKWRDAFRRADREADILRAAIHEHRAAVMHAERNATTHDMTDADEALWAVCKSASDEEQP